MTQRIIIITLGTLLLFACGKTAKAPVASPGPQKAEDSGFEDDFFGSEDAFSSDTFSMSNTCTYEDKEDCTALKVTFTAVNAATGSRVSSSINGRAQEDLGIAIQVKASSSKYENGVADVERVALGFRKTPSDADTQVEGLDAAFLWRPRSVSNGSFEVVFRDVGRCLVEEAYNKKGDLDEDKAEECEDLEYTGLSKYEQTKSFSYRIEKGRLEIQKDAALQQIDAQCKSQQLNSIIGVLPSLFGGNPAGILSAGVSGFSSQMQCEAQRDQIQAQFDAQNPL